MTNLNYDHHREYYKTPGIGTAIQAKAFIVYQVARKQHTLGKKVSYKMNDKVKKAVNRNNSKS